MVAPSALADELAHWSWADTAWEGVGAESRAAYERWVERAWTRGQARRRARVVARRLWSGRPFAGPVRRRLQALGDLLSEGPGSGTDAGTYAPGWVP